MDVQNSLVNILYVLMAWMAITGKDCMEFEENTCLYVYGDDLIMSVTDKYADIFNAVSLSEWFALYKLKFTDVNKTGEIVAYRSLYECDFLKRRFLPHPIRNFQFLASLDDVSCESCVNWIRKCPDRRLATIGNCKQALELAYSRGSKYYDWLRDRIECNLAKLGVYEMFLTWDEIDARVFDQGLIICRQVIRL